MRVLVLSALMVEVMVMGGKISVEDGADIDINIEFVVEES